MHTTAPRLTLVTARRPGGPGISPHNHLSTGNTSAALTLCGLQVRTPINHQAPATTLADCQNCQRALKAQGRRFTADANVVCDLCGKRGVYARETAHGAIVCVDAQACEARRK